MSAMPSFAIVEKVIALGLLIHHHHHPFLFYLLFLLQMCEDFFFTLHLFSSGFAINHMIIVWVSMGANFSNQLSVCTQSA